MQMQCIQQQTQLRYSSGLIDHQGIEWQSETGRKKARARRQVEIKPYRCKQGAAPKCDVPAMRYDTMFNTTAFHAVRNMREAHFQSKYTLSMCGIPNILLHQFQETLLVYDACQQQTHQTTIKDGFEGIGISAQDYLCVIAGMSADLVFINLKTGELDYKTLNTSHHFTNHAQFHGNDLIVCDNGHHLRIYDVGDGHFNPTPIFDYRDRACVNLAAVNKDNLIAFCADRLGIHLMDRRIGKIVQELQGHADYGYCVDFNPIKPYELASGSQDNTCLVHDIRNPNKPIQQIQSRLSSVYNVRYTNRHLLIGESYDFLHIVKTDTYEVEQVVDFFGSLSGIATDPFNDDQFYFSVYINDHEGIFQMNHIH